MFGSKLGIFAALMTLTILSAASASGTEYLVGASGCKVLRKEGPNWKPANAPALKPGSTVSAEPFENHSGWVIWRTSGQMFLVPQNCLTEVAAAPAPTVSSVPVSAGEAPMVIAPYQKRSAFYAQLSVVSWQDTLKLTAPDGHTSSVIGNALSICPGIGRTSSISPYFDWGFSACALVGTSNLASRSDIPASDPLYYSEGLQDMDARAQVEKTRIPIRTWLM